MKKKCYSSIMLLLFISIINNNLQAQNNFFKQQSESAFFVKDQKRVTIPEKYETFQLDLKAMQTFLFALPSQQNIVDRENTPILEIPMPDGSSAKFHVWERSIMEKGLANQFPTMKTFTGQGITDKTAVIVMDISDFGFHAMILSSVTGNVFIDQYDLETTTNYIAYYRRDLKRGTPLNEEGFGEFNKDVIPMPTVGEKFPTSQCRAATLRTYRLAVACTGEYAKAATGKASPTVAQTLAKITTTVNRVVGVYEIELGIHLNLVANETSVVFTNPNTDPFTGNNNTGTLINESQTQITSIIGTANFDIGHTFSTGAGGLAGLGVVCNASQKASGITGTTTPTGDGYDIDYVAHEMGHQFGGNHTFNSMTDNCNGNGNRTPAGVATNCEPGSGTTIMAYAGICGSDNIGGVHQNPGAVGLQGWSDPQFHAASLSEIYKYTVTGTGNTCAVSTQIANTAPVVTSGGNFTIPINTPFILTGSATDADGDALTYSWEEIDVTGPFGAWDATPQVANIPLFRSFAPKTTGVRYFPQLDDVIGATTTAGERLPTIARPMKFRLTARDNKAGCGGTCYADATITTNATGGGSFAVTYPNDGTEVWYDGQTKTVTWNKVGTSAAPFNVANVSIELSTDGGYTYPITLLASTANDGTESVIVPANFTTQAKIRVRALGNVFYDMSDNDFTIAVNPNPPTTYLVAGNIKTPLQKAVKNSSINLSGSKSLLLVNNASGDYSTLLPTGNYVMKPFKNNDIKKNNGITSIDIILVQNHILNKSKLNSPYKIIAADVNNDKAVSNIDILFMKRLLLGVDTSFIGNRLWAFVDSTYQFPDTTNPFPYKDSISFTNLTANKTNQTFIGVKLGDVNYDWNPLQGRGVNTTAPLELGYSIKNEQTGFSNNQIKVPITTKNFTSLLSMQYTLNFNQDLYELTDVINNNLEIEFNKTQANKTGNVAFVWADSKSDEKTLADGTELFTLVLKPKIETQIATSSSLKLSLTNDITDIEAWDKDYNQHNIILANKQQDTRNDIFSIYPNPTSGEVLVNMISKSNKTIEFNLINVLGKTVFAEKLEAITGNNVFHLNLNKTTKLSTGIYFMKVDGNVQKILIK